MTAPTVSVILPTCGRPAMLARAIDSVCAQTWTDWELIVVENGPAGEALDVVGPRSRRDPRIRYVEEPWMNGARARNTGAAHARGEYLAFLDDDDQWAPEKLQRQMEIFRRDPAVALVTCQAIVVDRAGEILRLEPAYRGPLSLESMLTAWCCVWSLSSVVVRRACFERVGRFDARRSAAIDYDFCLRIATAYRMACVPAPLLWYRWHGGNQSADREHGHAEQVRALLRHRRRVTPAQRPAIDVALREQAHILYRLASVALDRGDYSAAARCFRMAAAGDLLVGLRIPWSRFGSSWYRMLRPYAAIAYCRWMELSTDAQPATPEIAA